MMMILGILLLLANIACCIYGVLTGDYSITALNLAVALMIANSLWETSNIP